MFLGRSSSLSGGIRQKMWDVSSLKWHIWVCLSVNAALVVINPESIGQKLRKTFRHYIPVQCNATGAVLGSTGIGILKGIKPNWPVSKGGGQMFD